MRLTIWCTTMVPLFLGVSAGLGQDSTAVRPPAQATMPAQSHEGPVTDIIKPLLAILLGGSGGVALFFTAYQAAIRRRAHLLEVYRQAFDMMDQPEIREARHFVYRLDRETFKREHWIDLDRLPEHKTNSGFPTWQANKSKAERVARSFDQLGLLVREGRLPMNLLARFYASPALRCWYQLSPYIAAERSEEGRNQPGHMWEWENLVCKIINAGLSHNKGAWAGVSKHDRLEDLIGKILHEHKDMVKDAEYAPAGRIWEMGEWYEFWKW